MLRPPLRSIDYEPSGELSLFERWEEGDCSAPSPPLSVRDPQYREVVVATLRPYLGDNHRLISVGAGNGFTEASLSAAGWRVLATDVAESALRLCRAKGLQTARFDLLEDEAPGRFDAVYCDGLMGHLWQPGGSGPVWVALALLAAAAGFIALISNELSDNDDRPSFGVRSDSHAAFYRPPAGWFACDAAATGLWEIVTTCIYHDTRAGVPRRREIIIAELLMDERVEAEDRA